ncbi:MAG: glycoside hydrolase family 32 protein, partial [Bacteroidetes bacterium]
MRIYLPVTLWALAALVLGVWSSCQEDTETLAGRPVATYQEAHRPQFHFSPPTMWMNDPNGMVFFEGEYHLFYQYYPDSTVWGPMHWGHAVSKDLLHWEHLPIALAPDEHGYIFSGSAVVDWENSSGFGVDELPPLVAIFTYHDPIAEREGRDDFQTQGIAYSNDRGRSWVKYDGNPVLPNPGIRDFRDPKVIWDTESQRWIMVLAAGDHIRFYASKDLKHWRYLSSFGQRLGAHGGVWECPDLFPMKVEGSGDQRWVLLVSINPGAPNGGSGTQYFVGRFEDDRFKLDAEFAYNLNRMQDSVKAVWLDYGRDNYAGVTWSDIPFELDRRIFIGWMSN